MKYKISKKLRTLSPEIANMIDGFNLIDPKKQTLAMLAAEKMAVNIAIKQRLDELEDSEDA